MKTENRRSLKVLSFLMVVAVVLGVIMPLMTFTVSSEATNDSTYPFSVNGDIICSTNKAHSSSSTYTYRVEVAGTYTLKYKVSSESGWDYLTIKRNGSQLVSASGSNSSWSTKSVTVYVGDVITVTYSKDGSVSRHDDCGWVDFSDFRVVINEGSAATVSVNTSGYFKYFAFTPTQSGTYRFYSSNATGDPMGYLLNANNTTLTYDDNSGSSGNFLITYDCTANTVYYIKSGMYASNTGSYTLNVEKVTTTPPPTSQWAPDSYSVISEDSTAAVNIVSSGSAKYFRFIPTLSGTYKFYSTSASGDPKASLIDGNGTTLTTNDDYASTANFLITYDCTANTVYYIKAYMYSSRTGSYTLNVETVSTVSPPYIPTGDVNEDGEIDVLDVIVLRRYIAGGYEVEINIDDADMDTDGYITDDDVELLRRLLVE